VALEYFVESLGEATEACAGQKIHDFLEADLFFVPLFGNFSEQALVGLDYRARRDAADFKSDARQIVAKVLVDLEAKHVIVDQ